MESASNSGTRVGYTRLSTVAQTLDQQNTALAAAGVTKTVRSLNPTINICFAPCSSKRQQQGALALTGHLFAVSTDSR